MHPWTPCIPLNCILPLTCSFLPAEAQGLIITLMLSITVLICPLGPRTCIFLFCLHLSHLLIYSQEQSYPIRCYFPLQTTCILSSLHHLDFWECPKVTAPSHDFSVFCSLAHLLKCGFHLGTCHCHCAGLAADHQIQWPNGCVLSAPPLGFFQHLKLLTSFLLEMLPMTLAFGNCPSCIRACVLSFSCVSFAKFSFPFPRWWSLVGSLQTVPMISPPGFHTLECVLLHWEGWSVWLDMAEVVVCQPEVRL